MSKNKSHPTLGLYLILKYKLNTIKMFFKKAHNKTFGKTGFIWDLGNVILNPVS